MGAQGTAGDSSTGAQQSPHVLSRPLLAARELLLPPCLMFAAVNCNHCLPAGFRAPLGAAVPWLIKSLTSFPGWGGWEKRAKALRFLCGIHLGGLWPLHCVPPMLFCGGTGVCTLDPRLRAARRGREAAAAGRAFLHASFVLSLKVVRLSVAPLCFACTYPTALPSHCASLCGCPMPSFRCWTQATGCDK